MKLAVSALVLSVWAVSVAAQPTPDKLPEGGIPVASPNRTPSSQLVSRRPVNLLPPGRAKDAVSLVDANGRSLGRAFPATQFGEPAVVSTVNGKLTVLTGVGSPLMCDSTGNNCNYDGNLQWTSLSGFLFYESHDCSGDPMIDFIPMSAGFEQVGVVLHDVDGTYMYMAEPRSRRITVGSIRAGNQAPGGQCFQAIPYRRDVLRVTEAIPIGLFGTPPLRWR